MPAVLPQMHGDSHGARGLGQAGRFQGIGGLLSPGLPEGGDMVDIDAETGHGGSYFFLLVLREMGSRWTVTGSTVTEMPLGRGSTRMAGWTKSSLSEGFTSLRL